MGQWRGLAGITVGCEPQHGPADVHPDLGVCTVGSCPLIVNYNILVQRISMPAGVSWILRCVLAAAAAACGGAADTAAGVLMHARGSAAGTVAASSGWLRCRPAAASPRLCCRVTACGVTECCAAFK